MKTLSFLLLIASLTLAACQPAMVAAPEQNPPIEEEPSLIILPNPGSDTEQATPPTDSLPNQDLSLGQPQKPDLAPRDEDRRFQTSIVYIETHELLPLESDDPAYPLQFLLHVSGALPDPCHELRMKVNEPDQNGRVDIQLYSLRDPEMICIQVLQDFTIEIPLQFPAGSYQLYLNGERIAEFQG